MSAIGGILLAAAGVFVVVLGLSVSSVVAGVPARGFGIIMLLIGLCFGILAVQQFRPKEVA